MKGRTAVLLAMMAAGAAVAAAPKKAPPLQPALEPVPAEAVERITAALPDAPSAKRARPHRILVFTLTRGFRHSSIAAGAKAFELMGEKTRAWKATVTDDPGFFAPEKIRAFDAVVLMNTTGDLFLPSDMDKMDKRTAEKALKRAAALKASLLAFVRRGNGVVGIHAATDAWYDWPDFGPMIGGWFNGHPWNEKVGVRLEDPAHPLVAAFGGSGFQVRDEIYTFRSPWSRRNLRVLLTLDRAVTPHKGNRTDEDYALAWIRNEGKGRIFYCGFGHYDEIFWNPAMLRFMFDGTRFALGGLKADATPSSAAIDDPVDPFIGDYAGTFTPAVRPPEVAPEPEPASAAVYPVSNTKFQARFASGALRVEAAGEFDGTGIPLSRASSEDFIVSWEAAGPFAKEGVAAGELLGTPFPPEEGDAPPASGAVAWKPVTAGGKPPVVDLLEAVGGENRAAYLRATVDSPEEQDAVLELGSDDGIKAWLNGKPVHENNAMRGLEPGEDRVEVRLLKGPNTLLLKVSQGGGGWGACASVVPKAVPVKGVRGPAAGEARWTGRAAKGRLELSGAAGTWALRREEWKSKTEGLAPPAGAVVLLAPGAPTMEAWDNRNWRIVPDGSVEVNGGDARTKRKFGDFTLHVEFRVPYVPGGSGQDRGNSGIYFCDRYEIQVLDSFGIEPESHQCAGIYGVAAPRVNAALPPGSWQTYDVVFRAPVFGPGGEVVTPATFVRVEWNGVLVHENLPCPKSTGGAPEDFVSSAPLRLQDHGHRVRYRNMWIVEGAPKP